ncbi:hypothetical protein [Sinimarinibacterium sp. NLF-5-8]|uniref:hypothetical protein n=1 Tax=Sinimarinibacterium sp. NLF-5-8 TaxID=2698684 RepID=UPI00137BD5CC|nr:hypothetical protein [Sinimarinibacterium sp. NLF-5-8]QHS09023.1 hypothetical protein GT972_01940 [Sinimarinibacterium sp. NLF-5-8]
MNRNHIPRQADSYSVSPENCILVYTNAEGEFFEILATDLANIGTPIDDETGDDLELVRVRVNTEPEVVGQTETQWFNTTEAAARAAADQYGYDFEKTLEHIQLFGDIRPTICSRLAVWGHPGYSD